jgi:aminopeptidase
VFDEFPAWRVEYFEHYDSKNAAYISIISNDPENMKGVDPDRLSRFTKVSGMNLKKHHDRIMNSSVCWTVAAIPSPKWAQKVFPKLDEDAAMDALWQAIAKAARVDGPDPAAEWTRHNESFLSRTEFLNTKQFVSLRIKSSLGTDLTLGLPDNHIWAGGGEKSPNNGLFFPNIPTEEIFTAPHRLRADGRVVASMPLIYQGNLIEGIDITFKDGKVAAYTASQNYELLKGIIETDEGAAYLGEIALVPYDSPISQMKTLFYNTLFDENASCHLALGMAYPNCVSGTEGLGEEQLKELGLNISFTHVDFMFGTADLEVVGVDGEGNETKVFENGGFVV